MVLYEKQQFSTQLLNQPYLIDKQIYIILDRAYFVVTM